MDGDDETINTDMECEEGISEEDEIIVAKSTAHKIPCFI